MLTTSTAYLDAILSMSRKDRITGTLKKTNGDIVELDENNIADGTTSISRECAGGEEIEFGSATIAQLDISIRTQESRYVFYDAQISLFYGIQIQDGTWVDIPLGVFTVAEADRKNAIVALTAYDNILQLNKDYGGSAIFGTPYKILSAVCETCGVELGISEEEIQAMPNGNEQIQIDQYSGCLTYRDCAKVVAQMLGAFLVADRSGSIILRHYSKTADISIPKRIRKETKMCDYICTYMGIRLVSTKGEFRSYDIDQDKGLELIIPDAPAWDYGLDETLQARADTLLNELIQIVYTPGEFQIAGNPALECGDMVDIETDDGVITTLITSYKWEYHGAMKLKSTGKNPYLKSQVTRETVNMRELQAQTESNKLIFYSFTNQDEVRVSGTTEREISQVTFATIDPTSAMFLAQLPVIAECEDRVERKTKETVKTVTAKTASGAVSDVTDKNGDPLTLTVVDSDTLETVERGYVDLRVEYYMLGTLVDYELVQRLQAGKHILALFYTFPSLDGDANFQWQIKMRIVGGEGTVIVPKKGLRATVTGQGLAGTGTWDGTINFDQTMPELSIASALKLMPAVEEVETSTQVPKAKGLEQTITRLSLRPQMYLRIGELSERISATEIRKKKTIDLAEWVYNERYVAVDSEGIMARMEWVYHSEEQNIDNGRMTVVKAVTNDLASVKDVTVSG